VPLTSQSLDKQALLAVDKMDPYFLQCLTLSWSKSFALGKTFWWTIIFILGLSHWEEQNCGCAWCEDNLHFDKSVFGIYWYGQPTVYATWLESCKIDAVPISWSIV